MKNQDYHKGFITSIPAGEAFKRISQVDQWWAANFTGSAANLNDIFRVDFGKTWVTFKLTEVVKNEKYVWLVTDCYLDWLSNKTEWTGTKILFQISADKDGTKVEMTHIGLVPGIECYDTCNNGWNNHFGNDLQQFMATGQSIFAA